MKTKKNFKYRISPIDDYIKQEYSVGGVFKDWGRGIADSALSVIGLNNVIDEEDYETKFGKNFANKAAEISGKIAPAALSFVPGVGTVAGMGLGALQGAMSGLNPQDNQEADIMNQQPNTAPIFRKSPYRSTFKCGGRFDYGGLNYPNSEVENNEVLQSPQGYQPTVFGNSDLQRTSSNTYKAEGSTHENGGVQTNMPSGTRIFSDRLKSSNGKTFAKEAEKLSKLKGKYEKMLSHKKGTALGEDVSRSPIQNDQIDHGSRFFAKGGQYGGSPDISISDKVTHKNVRTNISLSNDNTKLRDRTATLMIEKINKKLDNLFNEQEASKIYAETPQYEVEFAKGGVYIKAPRRESIYSAAKKHNMDINDFAKKVIEHAEGGMQPYEDDGNLELYAEGGKHWIQDAVNPAHKGYCTPMTKATCTPRRKAFAMTMKKHHGFHEFGGLQKFDKGGGMPEEPTYNGIPITQFIIEDYTVPGKRIGIGSDYIKEQDVKIKRYKYLTSHQATSTSRDKDGNVYSPSYTKTNYYNVDSPEGRIIASKLAEYQKSLYEYKRLHPTKSIVENWSNNFRKAYETASPEQQAQFQKQYPQYFNVGQQTPTKPLTAGTTEPGSVTPKTYTRTAPVNTGKVGAYADPNAGSKWTWDYSNGAWTGYDQYGRATVLDPKNASHQSAITSLNAKYPQLVGQQNTSANPTPGTFESMMDAPGVVGSSNLPRGNRYGVPDVNGLANVQKPVGFTGLEQEEYEPESSYDYGNLAYNIAAYAPTIYNLGKGIFGKPKLEDPRKYMSSSYQTYKPIDETRVNKTFADQYALDRASIGELPVGTQMSNRLALANRYYDVASKANEMTQSQNMANKLAVDQYNEGINQYNRQMLAGINAQNQANIDKRSEYIGKGLEGLSNIAQSNRLMSNTAAMDQLKIPVLRDIYGYYDMEPEAQKYFDQYFATGKAGKNTPKTMFKYRQQKTNEQTKK